MKSSTQHDLLGFLLGALDAEEHEQTEQALKNDKDLQRHLSELDDRLAPLEDVNVDELPPSGVARRTCESVAFLSKDDLPRPAIKTTDPHLPNKPAFTQRRQYGSKRSWSLADVVVASAVCLVVGALLFPAISMSRQNAQIAACQDNLRQIGMALQSYSDTFGSYPFLPQNSPLGAAGGQGPILNDLQLVDRQERFLCPGSPFPDEKSQFRMPTMQEVDQASGANVTRLVSAMGGDYGWPLGVIQNNQYRPQRMSGRSFFVMLSDAPTEHLGTRVSLNHGRTGQNVVCEDLSVRWVADCSECSLNDHPFENHDGLVAGGVDENDAVVGASDSRPLPRIEVLRTNQP